MSEENRRTVHIINPSAGKFKHTSEFIKGLTDAGCEVFEDLGTHVGDAVKALIADDPHVHVVVYGGDGTVYDTVNAIMESSASDTASFSVVSKGSGNDFARYANESGAFEKGVSRRIDLMKTTCGGKTRYYANMMNIGFDCSVVWETYSLKDSSVFKGSAAYIAGVVKVLAKKAVTHMDITLTGCRSLKDGSPSEDVRLSRDFLLTAIANAPFCGGGFNAVPLASPTDSLIDAVLVNDMSRRKFISIISKYRAGTYIGADGSLDRSYDGILTYHRCSGMVIEGPERFCLDGEIFEADGPITVEPVGGAVNYIPV